jgi:hypothetical protein
MSSTAKILTLAYNSGEAVKDVALKSDYLSVRLIKTTAVLSDNQGSENNVKYLGKAIDAETRCLYVFYVDVYYDSAWIIEINLDNRVCSVVYYDKYNAIGFDENYKIYNARVVYGKLVWTDNKNPIYQMDIARAKKSFYYKIGYGNYTTVAEWSSTSTYGEDEICSDGNYFYKSLVAGNINHRAKDNDGTYWKRLCLIEDAYYSQNVVNFYFEASPPKMPPAVEYSTDATRRTNSLKQTLFQFAYRYVYMDWRKSTFSPASVVALPSGEEEANTGLADERLSINNELKITVNTGGEEVRAVEIIARSSQDPSKWFLIETINKFDEEERAGEISLLTEVEKNNITITVPDPTVSTINVADPDGSVPITISVPAPTAIIYAISSPIVAMGWDADESGAPVQVGATITVTGGHPSTEIKYIPAWITAIETAGGTEIFVGDPIVNGMEIALYPTADNTGPYRTDNFTIGDDYGNSMSIFVEQDAPIDVPVVSIEVHPEAPNEMTLSGTSGVATIGDSWIVITFTPNHPSFGGLVNFTMNYQMWRGGISVGSGTFIAQNLTSNTKSILMTGTPAAGDTIMVDLWEGTII